MPWRAYKLVYQAKSPVHIGYRTLGFIQRTRYYIPGRVIWGAITANLTRAKYLPTTEELSEVYRKVGLGISENVKLTYFYPALEADKPLLPQFTNEGLKYGTFSQEDFESLFIHARGQTAVAPETTTAEEESLHESEFIAPVVDRGDGHKPIFFGGYIIINEDKDIFGKKAAWDRGEVRLKEAVTELFVGGERKYGAGRLVLHSAERLKDKEGYYSIFGHNLRVPTLSLTIPCDSPIPAHVDVNGCLNLKGDVEPLVGREWGEVPGKTGPGQRIEKIGKCILYWVPGSLAQERITLVIGNFGLLSKAGM